MIVFTKNTSGTVYLTLSDKTTIDSPYYLMVLDSQTGVSQKKFLITDTSVYESRYNSFTVEEGVDFTAPKGVYLYRVLQKATADTDIDGSEVELERGYARVIDDVAEVDYIHTTTESSVIHETD